MANPPRSACPNPSASAPEAQALGPEGVATADELGFVDLAAGEAVGEHLLGVGRGVDRSGVTSWRGEVPDQQHDARNDQREDDQRDEDAAWVTTASVTTAEEAAV